MMHRNSAGVRDHRIEQKRQNIDPLFGAEHVLEGEVIRWLDPGSHSMTLSNGESNSEESVRVDCFWECRLPQHRTWLRQSHPCRWSKAELGAARPMTKCPALDLSELRVPRQF